VEKPENEMFWEKLFPGIFKSDNFKNAMERMNALLLALEEYMKKGSG